MSADPFAKWREDLKSWAIPQHILDAAPESPWIHPVENFTPRGDLRVDVPSRLRAVEALPEGGSVLDIGCGGGRAAFGLVPPAASVVGVDQQQAMLDVFAREAAARGVQCTTVLGDWPAVSAPTPACDVVVCHHVFYNVQDLAPFVTELSAHAHRRVVVELPDATRSAHCLARGTTSGDSPDRRTPRRRTRSSASVHWVSTHISRRSPSHPRPRGK